MRFVHDRDERSAFPFRPRAVEDAGMSILAQHAELRLRRANVQVTWPPSTTDTPALLVVVGDADAPAWQQLAVMTPAVLLAVPDATFGAAREALEWGADHAAELGADPRWLVLAGEHRGADLVAALARHARDRGWPRIARQVLIDPEHARVDRLARLLRGVEPCHDRVPGSWHGRPAA
jgi:alpha/beta hydrolase fold